MENLGKSSSVDVTLEECTLCGGRAARHSTQTQQFAYRDGAQEVLLVAEIPVISCSGCGETYTGPGAEGAQHDAVCRYLKRLTPGEIRTLRERKGLSQAKLAEVTGIGIASIKRWESGALIQNASLDAQLRSLDDRKERKAEARPTSRFRTELPPEVLEAAKLFRLRRPTKSYAEAA
jgi:putative zinc finger/helix-turn-helix YgiT family protein